MELKAVIKQILIDKIYDVINKSIFENRGYMECWQMIIDAILLNKTSVKNTAIIIKYFNTWYY